MAAKAVPEAHRQARSKRDQARKEYSEKQELESLQQVFKRLDKNGDKKIDAEELGAALKFIGHKCKRSEVQEMIWEIDEDCDGCVSWDECRNAFERVKKDYDGWEPRRCIRERKRKPKRTRDPARQSSHSSQPPLTHTTRTRMRHRVVSLPLDPRDRTGRLRPLRFAPHRFFNVVEFMMHDKDHSGTIDQDECMEILYRRLSIYIATRLCLRRHIKLSGRRRHMVGV